MRPLQRWCVMIPGLQRTSAGKRLRRCAAPGTRDLDFAPLTSALEEQKNRTGIRTIDTPSRLAFLLWRPPTFGYPPVQSPGYMCQA